MRLRALRAYGVGVGVVGMGFASSASAAPSSAESDAISRTTDVRTEVPILAYTYQAYGAAVGHVGAEAYGLGSAATGGVGLQGAKRGIVGGGVTAWASPFEGVTLVGDAPRDTTGNFAPSFAVVVRLLGTPGDGLSLGLLGKFKVEGFGVGVNDEVESEIEGGLLVSYAKYRWHVDLNAITGFGTGDDGEIDGEARFRLGHDVGSLLRVGIDGQARYRLAGNEKLVGSRNGDFAAGVQAMLGSGHFFGAITVGPTTANVYSGLGLSAVVTLGGSTL